MCNLTIYQGPRDAGVRAVHRGLVRAGGGARGGVWAGRVGGAQAEHGRGVAAEEAQQAARQAAQSPEPVIAKNTVVRVMYNLSQFTTKISPIIIH